MGGKSCRMGLGLGLKASETCGRGTGWGDRGIWVEWRRAGRRDEWLW